MPHFAGLMEKYLKKYYFVQKSSNNPVDIISKIRLFDVVHFLYSPTVKLRALLLLPILKIARKKVIVQWAGSHILQLYNSYKSKIINKLTTNMVDINLCGHFFNQKELFSLGVKCKIIKAEIVGMNTPKVSNLPDEFTILTYLPEDRFDFYGGRIIEKLIAEMKDTKFIVVGSKGKNRIKADNVKWLGKVPFRRMRHIYKLSTVLLRIPLHDNLSNMVIEALLYGRYVIYNNKFPHCCYAKNYDEVVYWLNVLRGVKKPNFKGREFAIKFVKHNRLALRNVYERISST